MIDSITLRIEDYVLYSDKFFTKTKYQELKGEYGVFGIYATRFTHYAKTCAQEGRYFPQVQIIERLKRTKLGMTPTNKHLVVQVSLPKLLFGTNIFDIDEKLLPVIFTKLVETLKEIDTEVTVDAIHSATVTRLDYSKIIQISPSYGSTKRILRALAPYDMKQSSDFNRSHYHDGRDGFYLKFFNSSQGLVLYDKFDEIVTNGKTHLEQEIARQYQSGKWTKGALRIELSLQKKQTVDSAIRQFSGEKKKAYTLQDVAKQSIAQACLLRSFESVYVTDFNRLIRLGELKDTEIIHLIENHVSNFRDRAIIYYLIHRSKTLGLKSAIGGLKKGTSSAAVGRYKRTIESVLGAVEAKKDVMTPVSYIHRKLQAFKLVLPKKLQETLKNVAESTTSV